MADFLDLRDVCDSIINRLYFLFIKKVNVYHREFTNSQPDTRLDPWYSNQSAKYYFLEAAKLAYSIPDLAGDHFEYPDMSIRQPFVSWLMFTWFTFTRDAGLVRSLQDVPELLAEVLVSMGDLAIFDNPAGRHPAQKMPPLHEKAPLARWKRFQLLAQRGCVLQVHCQRKAVVRQLGSLE